MRCNEVSEVSEVSLSWDDCGGFLFALRMREGLNLWQAPAKLLKHRTPTTTVSVLPTQRSDIPPTIYPHLSFQIWS